MNLTSFRRLLYSFASDEPLKNEALYRRRYVNWIPSISAKIENYLGLDLLSTTYTEYFDALPDTLEYFVKGRPISSITSIYSDTTGLYGGSETEETDYYIGKTNNSIVLGTSIRPGIKNIRVIYVGGLSTHGTQSQFTLSGEGSTEIATGDYVYGQDSMAWGYVVSKSGANITIEVLYGVFTVGEIIDVRESEDSPANDNTEATLATGVVRCLAETNLDLVQACELEIRYMDDHRSDFENLTTERASTERKDLTKEYSFLPEVESILRRYKNVYI